MSDTEKAEALWPALRIYGFQPRPDARFVVEDETDRGALMVFGSTPEQASARARSIAAIPEALDLLRSGLRSLEVADNLGDVRDAEDVYLRRALRLLQGEGE